MVIFHSYVSLPEGTKATDVGSDGWIFAAENDTEILH